MPTIGADIVGPSAQFNQLDWWTREDVTFLNGKKNIYHSWLVKSNVGNTDNVPWALGQITGATPLYQRHDAAGSIDQSKCWAWGYIFTDGSARFETKSNTGSDTLLQHIACQIAPGAKPRMWINGVEQIAAYLEPSNTGPWPIGGLAINNATHDLWIGRGSVNSRLWDGLVDEVRIIEDVKDTAYVATEYANLANIDDFVIFGDTETPSTRSPRNELVTGTVQEPLTLRFAADRFLDNPTTDTPTLETITAPTIGQIVKVNESLIDYKATGGTGLATFRTTYEAANKRVTAPVRITVTPDTDIPVVEGEIPLPTSFAATTTVGNDADLTSAINSHGGIGYKLINLSNNNYVARTITKDGIYLRAINLNGAIFTGLLNLSGNNSIVSRCKVNMGVELQGDNTRVHRCKKDSNLSENGVTVYGQNNIIDGNDLASCRRGIRVENTARNPIINRNWLHDQGNSPGVDTSAAIYIGEGKSSSSIKFNADISYNRTERWDTHQHTEIKGSGSRLRHHHGVGGGGFPPANHYIRHGLNNRMDFCWVDNGYLGICDDCDRDKDGALAPGTRVGWCVTTGTGGAELRQGELTGDDIRIKKLDGIVYCEDGLVVGHTGRVFIGGGFAVGPTMPKRTILEVTAGITQIIKGDSSVADPIIRALSVTKPSEEAARRLTPNVHCGQLWNTP